MCEVRAASALHGNVGLPIKCSDLESIQRQHSFTKAEIRRLWSSECFRSHSHLLPLLVPGWIYLFLLTRSVSDSSQSTPTDLSCPKTTPLMTFSVLFWKAFPGRNICGRPYTSSCWSHKQPYKNSVWSLDSVSNLWPCVFSVCLRGEGGGRLLSRQSCWQGFWRWIFVLFFFSPLPCTEWWVLIKKAFGQTSVKQYCCGECSDRDGFIFVFFLCRKHEKDTCQFLLVYVFGLSHVRTRGDYFVLSEEMLSNNR